MTKLALIDSIITKLKLISDKELLLSINEMLNTYANQEQNKTWTKLTPDQKSKILNAYEESKDKSRLIPFEKILK